MADRLQFPSGHGRRATPWVLGGLSIGFLALAALFLADRGSQAAARPEIALVDPGFLDPAPWRRTYANLVAAKEDMSDFDCYACHERDQPPPIRFDEQHNIILPQEHANIVLGHGSHNRNNLCFNCHNEHDLLTFQARDGRVLRFQDSTSLCGSCHGPTYRDWEAGAHGRISGYWDRSKGEAHRLDCANCHDPHRPRIPSRAPAPPPHPLRPATTAKAQSSH